MRQVDTTPAGRQHVIPGAERVTDAELTQKRAGDALRPNKPQAACDVGLFSDDRNQLDMF